MKSMLSRLVEWLRSSWEMPVAVLPVCRVQEGKKSMLDRSSMPGEQHLDTSGQLGGSIWPIQQQHEQQEEQQAWYVKQQAGCSLSCGDAQLTAHTVIGGSTGSNSSSTDESCSKSSSREGIPGEGSRSHPAPPPHVGAIRQLSSTNNTDAIKSCTRTTGTATFDTSVTPTSPTSIGAPLFDLPGPAAVKLLQLLVHRDVAALRRVCRRGRCMCDSLVEGILIADDSNVPDLVASGYLRCLPCLKTVVYHAGPRNATHLPALLAGCHAAHVQLRHFLLESVLTHRNLLSPMSPAPYIQPSTSHHPSVGGHVWEPPALPSSLPPPPLPPAPAPATLPVLSKTPLPAVLGTCTADTCMSATTDVGVAATSGAGTSTSAGISSGAPPAARATLQGHIAAEPAGPAHYSHGQTGEVGGDGPVKEVGIDLESAVTANSTLLSTGGLFVTGGHAFDDAGTADWGGAMSVAGDAESLSTATGSQPAGHELASGTHVIRAPASGATQVQPVTRAPLAPIPPAAASTHRQPTRSEAGPPPSQAMLPPPPLSAPLAADISHCSVMAPSLHMGLLAGGAALPTVGMQHVEVQVGEEEPDGVWADGVHVSSDTLMTLATSYPWHCLTFPMYTRGPHLRGTQDVGEASALCGALAAALPQSLRLLHITTACHLQDYGALARLTSLSYLQVDNCSWLTSEGLAGLSSLTALDTLSLVLSGQVRRPDDPTDPTLIDASVLRHLSRNTRLTELELSLHFADSASLCELGKLSHLQYLFLGGHVEVVGEGVWRALGGLPHLLFLQVDGYLELNTPLLPPSSNTPHTTPYHVPGLQPYTAISHSNSPSTLTSRPFPVLHAFWVGGGLRGVTSATVAALGPALSHVHSFSSGQLYSVQLEPACQLLSHITGLTKLQLLDLSRLRTPEAMVSLTAVLVPSSSTLTSLALHYSHGLNDTGVALLVRGMRQLRELRIRGCPHVTRAGLRALVCMSAAGGPLPRLRSIVLEGCGGGMQVADVVAMLQDLGREGCVRAVPPVALS